MPPHPVFDHPLPRPFDLSSVHAWKAATSWPWLMMPFWSASSPNRRWRSAEAVMARLLATASPSARSTTATGPGRESTSWASDYPIHAQAVHPPGRPHQPITAGPLIRRYAAPSPGGRRIVLPLPSSGGLRSPRRYLMMVLDPIVTAWPKQVFTGSDRDVRADGASVPRNCACVRSSQGRSAGRDGIRTILIAST